MNIRIATMLQILSRSRSCAVLLGIRGRGSNNTSCNNTSSVIIIEDSSNASTAAFYCRWGYAYASPTQQHHQSSESTPLQAKHQSTSRAARPSAPAPNYEDEEQPDISTEVQRSTSKTGGEGLGTFTVNQSSRSRSCQNFQHDSSQHGSSSSISINVGQPDKNVRSRSTSCIHAQHGSINEEGFLIGKTIPYGQERRKTQEASRKKEQMC